MDVVFVGVAGFLGAIARYMVYLLVPSSHAQSFPIATLVINLSGCLLAGLLIGLADRVSPELKHTITLVLIGFVGSFTTFSTFSAETLKLISSDQLLGVSLNVAANIIGGILLVWIGREAIFFIQMK